MSIEVSRTGAIKAHRMATIKIPEGSLRHVFWFALLGESDNTLWVAPVETLTVAAKVHSGNEDFGEPIDSFLEETGHYEVEKRCCEDGSRRFDLHAAGIVRRRSP
jgi:hypothetical protein